MKARTRTRATAARTGMGLALAASTVAAMTVPAGAATLPQVGTHGATLSTQGATALAPLPAAPQRGSTPGTYRVRAGDTVSAIALRTGTTVSAIVAANDLGSHALIKIGQVLRLSGEPASTSAPTRSATPTRHTVAAGDTVTALAKRYGTTIDAIVSANRLNSRALIIIGQQLTIPGGADSGVKSASSSAGTGSSSERSTAQTHVVRAGDTVSGIAKQHGTSVSQIVSANGLSNAGLIFVGQRLTVGGSSSEATRTVPVSNTSGGSSSSESTTRTHTVRSGDNLTSLAQRYGTSVSALTSENDLSNAGMIYVGQRLTIPGASSSSGGEQLVGDSFLGRTYASDVVSAANRNKATLLSMDVPSRSQMRTMVRDTAARMGVDPALALAVAQQESGFDARAVSPANAVGTMQVIPSSGEWASGLVGRDLNLLDPQDNVTAGVAILRQLVRTADNFDQAVAGYYQGLAGVRSNGMYADTRNYVSGIKNLMRQF